MSHAVTISDSVLSVAALLRNGDHASAYAQWRETIASADSPELVILTECGRILSEYPQVRALRELRELWHRSAAPLREVIEACVPNSDERHEVPAPPVPAPRWDRAAIEKARARASVRTRTERDQIRPRRAARAESRPVRAYFDSRAGVDDQPRRD